MGAAVAGFGIPDVAVLGGPVEVAAGDERVAGVAALREPALEPVEPRQLGRVEG
jgi:hypothetical protein